jgi:hypothetical protein
MVLLKRSSEFFALSSLRHFRQRRQDPGYRKVQTDLVLMRRAGDLPYSWLADNTRWQRKPRTFDGVADALRRTAQFYRKALWTEVGSYVEVWLEKDALAGVVYPVTEMYDVPLMVARGYASLSFLYDAAENIGDRGVPAYIYHFGDFDPSGVNAGEKIEQTLRELAPDAEIYFEPKAVRDQAHADAERAEGALERVGPTSTPQSLKTFARQAREDRSQRAHLSKLYVLDVARARASATCTIYWDSCRLP